MRKLVCKELSTRHHADRWEYWRKVIERQQVSGLSIPKFCSRDGVDPSSFYAWRQRLGMRPQVTADAGDFVEIKVAPLSESGIFLEVAGVAVRLDRGFDKTTLRDVVLALRSVDA